MIKEKFFIRTFGCQMNVSDTERMTALLAEQGMDPTEKVDEASLIIINGCTVREKAVHKAVSTLGTYQGLRLEGKKPLIGVGGCVGQLDKADLFKRAPYLDFVFGKGNCHKSIFTAICPVQLHQNPIHFSFFATDCRF